MKNNFPKGERHIRINHSLLNSPAFVAFDATALKLFIDLRAKLNGSNNGNINATFSELAQRGWRSPATLSKALKQLLALGFIAKTRETIGVEKGSKVCNLYRFTDLDCFEVPKLQIKACKATSEYLKFSKLTDARATKEQSNRKKRTLQKVNRDASITEATTQTDASEIEVIPLRNCSKNEASNISSIASQPIQGMTSSRNWASKRFGKKQLQKVNTFIDLPVHSEKVRASHD